MGTLRTIGIWAMIVGGIVGMVVCGQMVVCGRGTIAFAQGQPRPTLEPTWQPLRLETREPTIPATFPSAVSPTYFPTPTPTSTHMASPTPTSVLFPTYTPSPSLWQRTVPQSRLPQAGEETQQQNHQRLYVALALSLMCWVVGSAILVVVRQKS